MIMVFSYIKINYINNILDINIATIESNIIIVTTFCTLIFFLVLTLSPLKTL